jgi:hypothetical protein
MTNPGFLPPVFAVRGPRLGPLSVGSRVEQRLGSAGVDRSDVPLAGDVAGHGVL